MAQTFPVDATTRTIAARGGPLRVRDYDPVDASSSTAGLVWVHGGGFGSGGLDMAESDAVARAVASTGRPVRTVDYRLVPAFPLVGRLRLKPSDNRYPAPVEDVVDAYRDTVERHPGRRVVIGGASAGACLAATAALRLRGSSPEPSGLLLLYGLFHARLPPLSPDLRRRLRGIARLGIAPEMIRRMTFNYVGTTELHLDPEVFPGTADTVGLPPTRLLDADHDALRASGEAFADHLRAAGVPVESSVVADARHGFLDHPGNELFERGVEAMNAWIRVQD